MVAYSSLVPVSFSYFPSNTLISVTWQTVLAGVKGEKHFVHFSVVLITLRWREKFVIQTFVMFAVK